MMLIRDLISLSFRNLLLHKMRSLQGSFHMALRTTFVFLRYTKKAFCFVYGLATDKPEKTYTTPCESRRFVYVVAIFFAV